jgi:hypothetical protein
MRKGSDARMKLAAALLLFSTAVICCGQQTSVPLTATPNRPTVTNTAETTQFGVLEIEFGISAAARQQYLQGLLKFGLLRDLELDWAGDPWQHDALLHYTGVSDNVLGFRWRFLHQGQRRPTLTVEYSGKIPTAGPVEGSGQVDHIVTLLASKDLPARFHLDTNLNYQWLGRPGGGFDHNWAPDFTLAYSLSRKWGVAMEFSGSSRANVVTPATVQNLWAVSYIVKPRLVLDSAVQFRVTGNVPRFVYLGGFTYSIADLYHRRH